MTLFKETQGDASFGLRTACRDKSLIDEESD